MLGRRIGRSAVAAGVSAAALVAGAVGGLSTAQAEPALVGVVTSEPDGVGLAASLPTPVAVNIPARMRLLDPRKLSLRLDPGVSCRLSGASKFPGSAMINQVRYSCTALITTARRAGFTASYRSGATTFSIRVVATFKPKPVMTTLNLGSPSLFTFLMTNPGDGSPARWQPCNRVLTVRVNLNGVAATEQSLVVRALDQITAATGIKTQVIGTTTFIPTRSNTAVPAPGADIAFAFAGPGTGVRQTDWFTNPSSGVVGLGMAIASVYRQGNREWREYEHGKVVMDARLVTQVSPSTRQVMYMHELGHVLGLGHVHDANRTQIMEPALSSTRPPVWGNGDRAGLLKLGRMAGCLPTT